MKFLLFFRQVGELLCRNCGATITRQSELINVTALEQRYKYKYDFPVVGKTTTVHVFENPAGMLMYHSLPSSEATWFPGMQWTVCVCSKSEFSLRSARVRRVDYSINAGTVLDELPEVNTFLTPSNGENVANRTPQKIEDLDWSVKLIHLTAQTFRRVTTTFLVRYSTSWLEDDLIMWTGSKCTSKDSWS
ncbi:unnamed protein product [Heligmosomoides polygyrus]|uniref:CULT domain-containing protein n=1 Tax=Heligmosomoides polygyrus TaxID=6339 RepID=A0A183FUJ0_HELPZ|nr:unnamed protein product [Heligmosomoides polygyrus]